MTLIDRDRVICLLVCWVLVCVCVRAGLCWTGLLFKLCDVLLIHVLLHEIEKYLPEHEERMISLQKSPLAMCANIPYVITRRGIETM